MLSERHLRVNDLRASDFEKIDEMLPRSGVSPYELQFLVLSLLILADLPHKLLPLPQLPRVKTGASRRSPWRYADVPLGEILVPSISSGT